MTKKIAILRGINVGGKRKVLMADLRGLLTQLGLSEVETYIQSGNVIFSDKDNQSNIDLGNKIEAAILYKYDFEVPVIVRTADEIKQSVKSNPFFIEGMEDVAPLHLTFLKEPPSDESLSVMEAINHAPDEFKIIDQDVFIYCDGKYHQTKLSNAFFEKKLKVSATTRNWKTVLKLLELSNS